MNTAPEPLTPDALDALLSAEIDGDLAGAAAELGLSEPEALAQIATTPGAVARRAALARARDVIATRTELDPALETRLVAAAMARDDLTLVRERRNRRQWRALVAAGSVAAAIALIVVVGKIAPTSDDSSKSLASRATPSSGTSNPEAVKAASPTTAPAGGVDFGDVTHNAALAPTARRALKDLQSGAASGVSSTKTAADAPGSVAPPLGANSTTPFRAAVPPACTPAIRSRFGLPGAPLVIGTGTVSGRPVEILVFAGPAEPIAYVVYATDCSLVRTQGLG